MQHSFISMMISETAEIRIEYSDYIIARGFLETFNEWIKGCTKSKENSLIKWGQRYSFLLSPLGGLLMCILYGFFIYSSIDLIIGSEPTLVIFAKYLVISTISFVLALQLSRMIFKQIENSIDRYVFISWINLNKGDEKAIKDASSNQIKNFGLFALTTLGAITLGVVSSQISNLIDKIIS